MSFSLWGKNQDLVSSIFDIVLSTHKGDLHFIQLNTGEVVYFSSTKNTLVTELQKLKKLKKVVSFKVDDSHYMTSYRVIDELDQERPILFEDYV